MRVSHKESIALPQSLPLSQVPRTPPGWGLGVRRHGDSRDVSVKTGWKGPPGRWGCALEGSERRVIHSWFIHSRSPAAPTVSHAPHEEYKRGLCPLTILGADRATRNQQKCHEGGFIQGRRLGGGRAAQQTRHPGAGTRPAFTAPHPRPPYSAKRSPSQ